MKHTVPAGANMPFQRVQICRSSGCKDTVLAGAFTVPAGVWIPFQQVRNTVPAGACFVPQIDRNPASLLDLYDAGKTD